MERMADLFDLIWYEELMRKLEFGRLGVCGDEKEEKRGGSGTVRETKNQGSEPKWIRCECDMQPG